MCAGGGGGGGGQEVSDMSVKSSFCSTSPFSFPEGKLGAELLVL